MTADEIREQSAAQWMPHTKPETQFWLLDKQGDGIPERLAALGNAVVPQCARLALHLVARAEIF